jgi:NSS family neurotransmitter:Na+ symporter
MMPIAALAICVYVVKFMTIAKVEEEVMADDHPFKRRKVFAFMIRFLCPFFIAIILFSSIANVMGWIKL